MRGKPVPSVGFDRSESGIDKPEATAHAEMTALHARPRRRRHAGMTTADDLDDAAKKIVAAVG